MAQIIQGGTATFDASFYGAPTQSGMQFLREQLTNISQNLTDAGRAFYQSVQSSIDNFNFDYAARMARAAGRAVMNMWTMDVIQPLTTIGELQHAPPVMQRWVMAEPSIRKLYNQGRADGYSESYKDLDPGHVGEQHYDYRRATDGYLFVDQEPDAEGNVGWQATTYFDQLLPTDEDLSFQDQIDIQTTWAAIRKFTAKGGEDPTSKFNADLG